MIWRCPYCKFECSEQQDLKEHFIASHYYEMKTIAMRSDKLKTISWAAAWKSTFCSYKKND